MHRLGFTFLVLILGLLPSGCDSSVDDSVLRVAFIGSEIDLNDNDSAKLSVAAQSLRSATAQGLVEINERGEIVPALAERWIVTDDGMSYIFRLRNTQWPGGTKLTGANARAALERNIKQLHGTSLGLDLEIISDVKAMTGRVLEIRLKSPMPQFLELLAQPELGLRKEGEGTGPMEITPVSKRRKGEERKGGERAEKSINLQIRPGERANLEDSEYRNTQYRQILVTSLSAEKATKAFDHDQLDAVFNGQLLDFPLANTGPLARGTVRLDGVFGLFGLQIGNAEGLLADVSRREALAMVIDREELLKPFAVGGWYSSTRIVPSGLPGNPIAGQPRWGGQAILERQAEANRRILAWKNGAGHGQARLSIRLPDSNGAERFFNVLRQDFQQAGVTLERAAPGKSADLILVDRLARYGDARWFLNQFNCSLKRGLCSAAADAKVAEAVIETDLIKRAQLLAEAENILVEANIYIPFGAPVRWSLLRGGINGFMENSTGVHPLFPMASRPM